MQAAYLNTRMHLVFHFLLLYARINKTKVRQLFKLQTFVECVIEHKMLIGIETNDS